MAERLDINPLSKILHLICGARHDRSNQAGTLDIRRGGGGGAGAYAGRLANGAGASWLLLRAATGDTSWRQPRNLGDENPLTVNAISSCDGAAPWLRSGWQQPYPSGGRSSKNQYGLGVNQAASALKLNQAAGHRLAGVMIAYSADRGSSGNYQNHRRHLQAEESKVREQ